MGIRLEKKTLTNGLLIVFILILLFTPLGFKIKVGINQLFSGNPGVLQVEKQVLLDNYTWDLVDLQGKPTQLQDLTNKVLVVNFWATWCPPCVAEMPAFQSLYEDYGAEVAFLFVAEDDYKKVTAFVRKKGYTLPVYFSTSPAPEMLVSPALPTTYIIDRTGKIVVKEVGAADWNSKATRSLLDQLLVKP